MKPHPSPRSIVMNGTPRPLGLWRIAGVGPCEWILSHRWFFRLMDCDGFRSIYTPKPRRARRTVIPGLDHSHRRFRTEPRDEEAPF